MNSQAWILLVAFLVILALLGWPLGRWLVAVAEGRFPRWFAPFVKAEHGLYRIAGVDAGSGMGWRQYAIALVVFNLLGVLAVYALQRIDGQHAEQVEHHQRDGVLAPAHAAAGIDTGDPVQAVFRLHERREPAREAAFGDGDQPAAQRPAQQCKDDQEGHQKNPGLRVHQKSSAFSNAKTRYTSRPSDARPASPYSQLMCVLPTCRSRWPCRRWR